MTRCLTLICLVLLVLGCAGNNQASDEIGIEDIHEFLSSLPFKVVVVEKLEDSRSVEKRPETHFLTLRLEGCSHQQLGKDTTLLLRSQLELDTRVLFTHVPIEEPGCRRYLDAVGNIVPFYETDSMLAPTVDSAGWLAKRIKQYGLALKRYNQLRAKDGDLGGWGQLLLSGCLLAFGIWGIADGEDGGKLAGMTAMAASPFALASSIRQIGEDRHRERQIVKIELKLRVGRR